MNRLKLQQILREMHVKLKSSNHAKFKNQCCMNLLFKLTRRPGQWQFRAQDYHVV